MASDLPEARILLTLLAWIAQLAAGYDAGNQHKSDAVIHALAKARFVAEGEPASPAEAKDRH